MNQLMEEDQDYIPKDLNILLEDAKSAPEGEITNQSSDLLMIDPLKFNAFGLMDHGRKTKDGVIIFGKVKQSNQMPIDYYLNFNEDTSSSSYAQSQSHLFIVYYNKDTRNYVIKFNIDEKSELARNVYVKLLHNSEYPIKNKEIVNIKGLIFHFIPCSNGVLNIIDVHHDNKKLVFKPKKNSVITIGKDGTCTLQYPDANGLSKVHIQVIYSNENYWILKNCQEVVNEDWENRLVGVNSYNIIDGFEVEVFKKRIRFNLSN